MRKFTTTAVALLLTVGLFGSLALAGPKDEDTIKNVMKAAMKGGLCKKVGQGKASDTEKQKLVELFDELAKATPPKGEAASWKAKTTALLAAAKDCASDKPGANAALGKAANCKSCHDAHKGQ